MLFPHTSIDNWIFECQPLRIFFTAPNMVNGVDEKDKEEGQVLHPSKDLRDQRCG